MQVDHRGTPTEMEVTTSTTTTTTTTPTPPPTTRRTTTATSTTVASTTTSIPSEAFEQAEPSDNVEYEYEYYYEYYDQDGNIVTSTPKREILNDIVTAKEEMLEEETRNKQEDTGISLQVCLLHFKI